MRSYEFKVALVIIVLILITYCVGRASTPPVIKEVQPKGMTIEQERVNQEYINEKMTAYIENPRNQWCFETDRDVCTNQGNIDDLGDIAQKMGYTLDEYGIAAQLFITQDGLTLSIQAVFLSKVIKDEKFVHIWNLVLVHDDRQPPGNNDI